MTKPPRNPDSPLGPHKREPLPLLLAPDDLELRTWLQLVRTFMRLERHLEHGLEAYHLSLPQLDILATLGRDEGITQRELAERLLVTKGNICGMIDRMEANDWVQRRPDPTDRRANRLFLTPQGRTLLAKIKPEQIAVVRNMMGVLQENQLQTLFQYLVRLEEGVE